MLEPNSRPVNRDFVFQSTNTDYEKRGSGMQSDFNWIMKQSLLPYLKLDIEVPYAAIYQEILALKQEMGSQLGRIGVSGWKGAVLHGLAFDKMRPHRAYGYENEDDAPYKWTEMINRFPVTRRFVEATFPCKKLYRVKINLLQPGGRLWPHKDADHPELGLNRPSPDHVKYVTMGIHWPKGVVFQLGKYTLPIKNGDAYLIDLSNYHAVYNNSTENRYSLVVSADYTGGLEWEELVVRSYEKYGGDVCPALPLTTTWKNRLLGSSRHLVGAMLNTHAKWK